LNYLFDLIDIFELPVAVLAFWTARKRKVEPIARTGLGAWPAPKEPTAGGMH
jgi:hypothetical protein